MLRALLHARRRPTPDLVLLGLEAENFYRLLAGKPIRLNLRHLHPDEAPIEDLPDLDVIIFHATPEAIGDLTAGFAAHGVTPR